MTDRKHAAESMAVQLGLVEQLASYLEHQAGSISFPFSGVPSGKLIAAALNAIVTRCRDMDEGWVAAARLLPEVGREVIVFDGEHVGIGCRHATLGWSAADTRIAPDVRRISHWRMLPSEPNRVSPLGMT